MLTILSDLLNYVNFIQYIPDFYDIDNFIEMFRKYPLHLIEELIYAMAILSAFEISQICRFYSRGREFYARVTSIITEIDHRLNNLRPTGLIVLIDNFYMRYRDSFSFEVSV